MDTQIKDDTKSILSTHNWNFELCLREILLGLIKVHDDFVLQSSRSLQSRQNEPYSESHLERKSQKSVKRSNRKIERSDANHDNDERNPEVLLQTLLAKEMASYQLDLNHGIVSILNSFARQALVLYLIGKCSEKNIFVTKSLRRYIDNISSLYSTIKKFLSKTQDDLKIILPKVYELLNNLHLQVETDPSKPQHLTFKNITASNGSLHQVENSNGILYEAAAVMPGTTKIGLAHRSGSKGSVCIFDFEKNIKICQIENLHKKWINNLIWIKNSSMLVTCSNDMSIKFLIFTRDRLRLVKTLYGHTDLIRCLKYFDDLRVLISGGDDPNLKVWNIKSKKLICTISTDKKTNMDGSFAYIPKYKLVGVGFRCGEINFYHIIKRSLLLSIKTGYTEFYTYGLQYHIKSKLIVGRVKEHTIKVWHFDEDNFEAKEFANIHSKGVYPDCLLMNEDGNELMTSSRDNYLEIFNLLNLKSRVLTLEKIKKTNCLRYLPDHNKLFICDYDSENFCMLTC